MQTKDLLTTWLAKLDLEESDLSDLDINIVRALLQMDQPLRSQLRWATFDNAIEKFLQILLVHPKPAGRKACPPLWFYNRSILLDQTSRLKAVYAITGFSRGTRSFIDRTVNTFLSFILLYGLFGNEINFNPASLFQNYQNKDDIGIVNLVYLLNHFPATALRFILFSPLIWGLVKTIVTGYQVARPSSAYLQTLEKRLRNYQENVVKDTFYWLLPLYQRAQDFRKVDLLLSWDGRIYWDGWTTGAEELLNTVIHIAEQGRAYTQLEAMHVLKIIAHGVSFSDFPLLKRAGFSDIQLKRMIRVKTIAFQTLIHLRTQPTTSTRYQKAKAIVRSFYARYLLWELGAWQ